MPCLTQFIIHLISEYDVAAWYTTTVRHSVEFRFSIRMSLLDIINRRIYKSRAVLVLVFIASLTSRDGGRIVCAVAPAAASSAPPVPAESSGRSLEVALQRVADIHRVDNLTRQHGGDTFITNGKHTSELNIYVHKYGELFKLIITYYKSLTVNIIASGSGVCLLILKQSARDWFLTIMQL